MGRASWSVQRISSKFEDKSNLIFLTIRIGLLKFVSRTIDALEIHLVQNCALIQRAVFKLRAEDIQTFLNASH